MSNPRVAINCVLERVCVSEQALRDAIGNVRTSVGVGVGLSTSTSTNGNSGSGSKAANASAGLMLITALERVVFDSTDRDRDDNNKMADGDLQHWAADHDRGVTTTQIGADYVMMESEAPFSDVLNLAIEKLKLNLTDAIHAVGSIKIKNWKAIPLSAVSDSPSATIGEILGELANKVDLTIKMITIQSQSQSQSQSPLQSGASVALPVNSLLRAGASPDCVEQTERAGWPAASAALLNGSLSVSAPASASTSASASASASASISTSTSTSTPTPTSAANAVAAAAALCSGDLRVLGSFAALAAAQQQASLFNAAAVHQSAVDRCCPDGNSAVRARSFGGADMSHGHGQANVNVNANANEQLLGSLQALQPSSLAAFMLLQQHAAVAHMASLHDAPQVGRLLMPDAIGLNGLGGLPTHGHGHAPELKCVDLAALRRDGAAAGLNFGVVGISSDAGDGKGLCGQQQQQRMRTSFDAEQEIPMLQNWFRENQHPSREQMVNYLKQLNSLDSRRSKRPLDLTNIIYWFKNSRAAKRRSERMQPQSKDAPDDGVSFAQYSTADRHSDALALGDSVLTKTSAAHMRLQSEAINNNNVKHDENDSVEISVDSDGDDADADADPDAEADADADAYYDAPKRCRMGSEADADADAEVEAEVDEGEVDVAMATHSENNNGVKTDAESRSVSDRVLYTPSSSIGSSGSLLLAYSAAKAAASSAGISADSYKRTRIFIDPLTEVPQLENWFAKNPHPDAKSIESFCARLNASAYRSKFPKLESKNIQLWFKNHRSKVKRLGTGAGTGTGSSSGADDSCKLREPIAHSQSSLATV